jgi:hypothetical protein
MRPEILHSIFISEDSEHIFRPKIHLFINDRRHTITYEHNTKPNLTTYYKVISPLRLMQSKNRNEINDEIRRRKCSGNACDC